VATNEDFLNTIMQLESGGRQGLTSSAGATGRMQTMGATRKDPGFGVIPAQDDSLEEGDRVGRDYALALLNHYDNDPALALAAYNSGPGTVNKYGGVPPYKETQNYVTRGLSMLNSSGQTNEEVSPEDLAWYEEYTKKQAAPATEEVTPEDLAWYEEYKKKQAEPIQEDRTAKEVGGDVGTAVEKGIIGVPQALVGLADIPTGGKVGKYLEEKGYNFENMQKQLSEQYSPQQKEDIKALEEAKGISENLKAAMEHPEAVLSMVGESAIPAVAGGMMGRVAKAAGLVKSTAVAAGVGEGLLAAGQSAQDIRVQSPERELSTKGALSALGAGAGTAALGTLGSKATTALGGIDLDTLIVGGARKAITKEVGEEVAKTPGMFRRVITSAFGEGVLEEAPQSAQEQMFQNYATDKPLLEGVENAAIKGTMLGSVMGGGIGLVPTGKAEEPTPTPTPTATPTEEKPLTEREIEYNKDQALKQRSNEIEAIGIPPETKLHDELLAHDLSTPEGVAEARKTIDTAIQTETDLPEDFDIGYAEDFLKRAEENLAKPKEVVTPEAEVTAPVPPPITTPTAETVAPEEQGVAQKQQTVEAVKPTEEQDTTGLASGFSGMAADMSESFYKQAFESLQQGKTTISGVKDSILTTAKKAFDAGLIKSPADLKNFEQNGYPTLAEDPEIAYEHAFVKLQLKKRSTSDLENSIIDRAKEAFDKGLIQHPEDIKKFEQNGYPKTTKEQVVQPETDQTFSVAPTEKSTPYTAELLKRSLTPEMRRLVDSGKAVLHDTQDTLPGTNHPANVQGMTTPEGITHYVANKLNPTTIQNVALHEVGVHTGMKNMVGDKVWEDVKNQAMTNQGPEFDAARASIPKDTPAHLHAEEALAYLVENSSHLPFIRRLIAAVRNWARTTFGTNLRLSQDDARHLATRALRKESQSKKTTARKEGTAYSISPEDRTAAESAERRRAENTPPPVSKPKRTFGEVATDTLDMIETMATSFDARYINQLRRSLNKSLKKGDMSVADITKVMLRASQAQSVHAGSVGAQGAIRGSLKKNDVTQTWDAVDAENNMPKLRLLIEDIAKSKGQTFEEVSKQFGEIMVASRIAELRQRPIEIKAKIDSATDEKVKKLWQKKYDKAVALANNQHLTEAEVAEQLGVLARNPEYKKPMDEWKAIRKNMVDFLEDTGRYSNAQAKAYLDAIAYVPFTRVMDRKDVESVYDTMAQGHGKATMGLTRGQAEHTIKGSKSREVDDIITNMERWVLNSFVKGMNADKGRELVKISMINMPAGTVVNIGRNAKNKEGAVVVYKGGIKEYYRYADPLMPFAFNGINPVALPALKLGAKFANRLRQSIVLNPLFTISQLPQDTFSAMFSSGLKNPIMLPAETVKEFVKTLMGTSKTHEVLKTRGATGQKDPMDMYAQSIHDIAYNQPSTAKGVIGANILDKLNRFSMAGDNALRQAIYNRTLKEMKGRPDAEAIATQRAFEIINFRRRGASASVDIIRQITPFLGAYLQAQRVAINTLSGRGIAPSDRKEALATLAATTAQVVALTFLYNNLLDDDEEFKKKSARDKDTRIFVIGSKSNLTLPLRPDIFSLPFVMGNHAYRAILDKGTENPEVARRAMSDAVIASLVGMPMGPTIIKPVVEVVIDHDFFTGRPLISQKLAGFEEELQYTAGSSEIAKMLGHTGMISPIAVDHLVRGFFGYTGGAALLASDIALRASLDLPYASKGVFGKGIRDIPGVPSLYGDEKKTQVIDSFFKMNADIDTAYRTEKRYKDLGRKEEAREYKTSHKELLNQGVRSTLHDMSVDISELRKKKDKILETPNEKISPEAKRERIDKIDERIARIMKRVPKLENKVYK
jgi:hypothetical protein